MTSASTSWCRSTRAGVTGSSSSACRRSASAPSSRRSTCSRPARPTSASSPRAWPTTTPARPSPRRGSSSSACRIPLPYGKVARLYQQVSRVAVVEELDPFLEDQVRALGLPVIGKEALPADGEFDQELVFRALEPFVSRRPPRRRRPSLPPVLRPGTAAAAGRPAARAPAGAVPRLLAPRGLHGAAQAQARADGRHRLLHPRRAAATSGHGQLPVHGRRHRHDGRLQQGARAQGGGGRHRRLHLLPLRHHAARRRALQRGDRARARAGQPHHGHDRSPGPPRHRQAPGRQQRPVGRPPEAVRGHRRALPHGGRRRLPRARRRRQGGGARAGPRGHRRSRPVRAHLPSAARARGRGRGALQPLRAVPGHRLPGHRHGRRRGHHHRELHRLRPVRRRLPPRRALRRWRSRRERYHHRRARRRRRPGHPARRRGARRDGGGRGPGRQGQRGQGHGPARRQRAQHRAVRRPGVVAGLSARRRGHRHRGARGVPRPGDASCRAARWCSRPPRTSCPAACCAARRSTPPISRRSPRSARCACSPVDAEALAREAGSARAVNIALLGAASTVLPFSAEAWRAGLTAAVPARILAVNERAFALGRDAAHQEVAP